MKAARRKVCITLPPAARAALRARVEELRGRLSGGAKLTEEGYLRHVLFLDLRRAAKEREEAATQILWQYDRVWLAQAAHAYRRCRGAVPIEELQDAAREEALKACRKVNGRGSPAALIRVWASYGVKALLKERIGLSNYQLIYPDTDERSRWDVLADEAPRPDVRCEGGEVSVRLQELVARLPARQKRAMALLAKGQTDDEVAAAAGLCALEVRVLREDIAVQLGIQPDVELDLAQAAALLGRSPASVTKMILSGRLEAQRRDGQWYLREADVMALAREKAA